ncbi:MAG: hypothetical protein R3C20_06060 [Planctomycetaceae bacterium]
MLSAGDIVTVDVVSPQVFGVFCRHGSDDMLVVIPQTSWIASFNSCFQFAEPGDRLTVRIRHVDPATGKIAASVKDVHPDPWETGKIVIGAQYEARVVRFVETADRCDGKPGYLIELLPGSYAMIPAKSHKHLSGDIVKVRILAADIRLGSVVVDWW